MVTSPHGPVRLKYATLARNSVAGSVHWGGVEYEVAFGRPGHGRLSAAPPAMGAEGYDAITISTAGQKMDPIPAELLSWIGVYLGEDVFGVGFRGGPPRPNVRGTLRLDSAEMGGFLVKAEKWSKTALTDKWRDACLRSAFGYFHSGIAMGLDLTPMTEGIFTIGAETLANAAHFNAEAHYKLKDRKRGPRSLLGQIADECLRKRLPDDLDLLIALRDKFGAHFGLHQARERKALCGKLRDWLLRCGCRRDFADSVFEENRLLEDLQVNAAGLYCTALTVIRTCFHVLIDADELLRFAERDQFPG